VKYASTNEVIRDLESNPAEQKGHIYHPIPFPEFSHLETSSNSQEVLKKWNLILQTMTMLYPGGAAGLSILDVGANAGFYTFSLAQQGARVTSFEPHPRYGPIGQFLAAEKGLDVDWHPVAFDPQLVGDRYFDFVLMLSVFQWMADGGNCIGEANQNLRSISNMSRYLIFELGFNRGKSCLKTGKLNHYAELVRMLAQNSVYEHFLLLGTTELWRSARRYLVLCSNERQLEDSLFRRIIRMVGI
jgi:SAM-dependent methyltransferase